MVFLTSWDREQASVGISREHAHFFTRNPAAILCEERLALTIGALGHSYTVPM
jgi:hypothetical protein